MRRANIEPCMNGYIIHIYTEGKTVTFIAFDEREVAEIIKRELKK